MTTARPQRADAVRNRRRILSAAAEQVTANGPEVGMDEIAKAAGVAVGTLYRHFPTKTDLLQAVVAEDVSQIADDAEASLVRARTRTGGRAVDELIGFLRRAAEASASSQAVKAAAARLGVTGHGELTDEARAGAAVSELIAMAQRDGVVRAGITVDDIYLLMATAPTDQPAMIGRWLDLVLPGLIRD